MIIRQTSDPVNIKERVFSVCDKHYPTNEKYGKGRRLKFCGTVHYASNKPGLRR